MEPWQEWRQLKQQVKDRSGGVCEGCGERDAQHVHHKQYATGGNRRIVPLEWLEHLCLTCHGDRHGGRVFDPYWVQQAKAKRRRKSKRKGKRRRKKGWGISEQSARAAIARATHRRER